jgi:very-short-patch-repair endonuclease
VTSDEHTPRRPVRGVVAGRRIDPAKVQRARDLRQAMTPAETRLWAALRGNRVRGLHFRRQQVIAGFIVDFYCQAAALVVEVDGAIHAAQADYDAARDAILIAQGLHVLRIPNADIARDLPGVVARIAAACGAT